MMLTTVVTDVNTLFVIGNSLTSAAFEYSFYSSLVKVTGGYGLAAGKGWANLYGAHMWPLNTFEDCRLFGGPLERKSSCSFYLRACCGHEHLTLEGEADEIQACCTDF